ncbi:hypothetical protein [Pseudomonas syringae]|uniref:hypothetical protein n=1 Tax=Pseudomonas syringae TaxID=317 RepID=UPI003B009FCD
MFLPQTQHEEVNRTEEKRDDVGADKQLLLEVRQRVHCRLEAWIVRRTMRLEKIEALLPLGTVLASALGLICRAHGSTPCVPWGDVFFREILCL